MKKKFWIVIVLFFVGVNLTACAESPGIELSSLPEDFYVQKAIESGDVEYPPTEEFIVHTPPNPEYPSGSYILLKYMSDDMYILSVFQNNQKICSWNNQISDPRKFAEKTPIFITKDNCDGVSELITWDLIENKVVPEEYKVWFNVGSQYFRIID